MLGSITSLTSLWTRAVAALHKLAWVGPLLVRVTLGLVFAKTGWGKLHSLDNVTDFFTSLHIPAPAFQAVFVSTIEFVGGVLLIAGLGTRIAAALLVGVMTVAIWTAKLPDIHGLFDLASTEELLYLVVFVWLVVAGAGAASIDHVIARRGGGGAGAKLPAARIAEAP
jgi:putative oxidoreductase